MDILVWLFLLWRKLRYKQKQTAKERKWLFVSATSFPRFSPTRPTERVGENPGNEFVVSADGGGEGTRDETHGFQNRTDRILNSYL